MTTLAAATARLEAARDAVDNATAAPEATFADAMQSAMAELVTATGQWRQACRASEEIKP